MCYSKLLRDLPRGLLRRGQKLYYRHTVPVDAQRLLNRLEIWRSLRTDSFAVALRRLPGVVARIETEIEHARAMAGLPVDATLIRPSNYDPVQHAILVELPPTERPQPDNTLTLAEAYRSYVDDPTRAWTANTRESMNASDLAATITAVLAKAPQWIRHDLSSSDTALCVRAEESLAAMIAAALQVQHERPRES